MNLEMIVLPGVYSIVQITDIENDRKEFIMSRTLMEKKELRDLNEEYRGNTGIVK